ncbi:MAG: protein O-GlcNAc transferase [Gammaproteobacteria bacterium]
MKLLQSGLAHHQAGRLQKAEEIYKDILQAQPRHADALNFLGVIFHQTEKNKIAINYIENAIKINPDAADYYNNCGIAYTALHKNEMAIARFEKALTLKPDHAEAHNNLGIVYQDLGRDEDAIACYEQALANKPDYAQAHSNLGKLLNKLGRLEDLIAFIKQLLSIKPDDVTVLFDLAVTLQISGRHEEAINYYENVLTINPDYANAHYNLGKALHELERADEAIVCYEQALTIKPNYVEALSNLGKVLKDLGRLDEALVSYKKVLAIKPENAEVHNNLGLIYQALGRLDDAVVCFEQALAIKPDLCEAHNNMGITFHIPGIPGKMANAITCYEKAISIKPDNAAVLNNLGNVLKDLGRLDEALASYEQAIVINPDNASAHSNLLMALNYSPSTTNSILFNKSTAWAASLEKYSLNNFFKNSPNQNRRLKIGYVSGDFSNHPVGYFMTRVLLSHDSECFDIMCFSDSIKSDDTTLRLQQSAKQWRNIVGLSDDLVSTLIRNDGIDILVDLSGHTGKHRLTLFATRPAPVQVTWLGYFATTGLNAMDYILADRIVLPEQEEQFYTEKVRRLPDSYLCFEPPKFDIDINTAPVTVTGAITFGCFNNYGKLNPNTIALWANIIKAIPGSCIILKSRHYNEPEVQQSVHDMFASNNIDSSRIIMEGRSSREALLTKYQHVDIALDPFPFGGGTTTVECLWMGVPVITMKGDRWVGRVSESILNTIGLPELIAANHNEYQQIAISLSNDIPRLKMLRATLRKTLESSPLCDGKRFTKNLELEYWSMWKYWCHNILNKKKE